jgi:predicted secreted protein
LTTTSNTCSRRAPRQRTVGPDQGTGGADQQVINRYAAVDAGATITLTLGSTPSMPCGWQTLEISDETVVRQVDRRSKWPAEGVTPMPGAPGVEVWILEAREEGESTRSTCFSFCRALQFGTLL